MFLPKKMSAIEFYLNKGFTPLNKSTVLSGTGTQSIWTPVAGRTVTVTNVSVSTSLAGTIAFYFEDSSKIAEFVLTGSATIAPNIGAWVSTVVSGNIFAKLVAGATDGVRVNLTGFEIPASSV